MINLKQDARITMLAALREKLIGGKVTFVDTKGVELVQMDITEIDPVIDDYLRFQPMQGYGKVYGKAKRAIFENKEELFDADVTEKGKGGTVELDNIEIVQDALVKVTSAVFSFAS